MTRSNFCNFSGNWQEKQARSNMAISFFYTQGQERVNHRKKHEFSMFLELDGSANLHPMNQGKQRGENVLLQITTSMVKTYFCGRRATSLWYLLIFSSLAPVFYLLTASLPFRSFHFSLYLKFRKKIFFTAEGPSALQGCLCFVQC